MAPTLQWVLHSHDLARSLARAQAFVTEAPERTLMERYTTWGYLGIRNAALERLDVSAQAYSRAADAISTPHILHQWAAVEMMRRHFSDARDVYGRIVERNPRDAFAWWSMAGASSQIPDWPAAYRATLRTIALDSTNTAARGALEMMRQAHPELVRSSR